MEGRTAGSARIWDVQRGWAPCKPSPRLVGNSDAKAQRSLPSASAKLSIFRSFEYLSCMYCSIDSPSLIEGKKMPCDVLIAVKGELMSSLLGCFSRNQFLAYCLNLDFRAERYSLSASCASGDGSETFSQGVLDTRHLIILRGEAALGS